MHTKYQNKLLFYTEVLSKMVAFEQGQEENSSKPQGRQDKASAKFLSQDLKKLRKQQRSHMTGISQWGQVEQRGWTSDNLVGH